MARARKRNKLALTRGMLSFMTSAAKHINAEYSAKRKLPRRRRGHVFADRYHQEIIKTPRQARRTLSYVLNNWRKHREDLENPRAMAAKLDPYASGLAFMGWDVLSSPATRCLVVPVTSLTLALSLTPRS